MTKHYTKYFTDSMGMLTRTTFPLHGHEQGAKVLMPRTTFISNQAITLSSGTSLSVPANTSAGKWHPDAGHLARIRHYIDRRPEKFKRPMLKPTFKKAFGGVDALLTTEDRLKTAPKVTSPSQLLR